MEAVTIQRYYKQETLKLVVLSLSLPQLLRMQRFTAAAKKGKVEASPELIKLWGTEAGRAMPRSDSIYNIRTSVSILVWMALGKKLRSMLYDNNMSMAEVNVAIVRESEQEMLPICLLIVLLTNHTGT